MPEQPVLLTELDVAAPLRYSPRGVSVVSVRSRQWRDAVKQAKAEWLAHAIGDLAAQLHKSGMAAWFGPDVTVIPVPRSAPLSEPKALWPSRMIADCLVERRLAKQSLTSLERVEAVPRSSTSYSAERTTADRHVETMRIEKTLFAPTQITLVDDVMTIGRTMLAAASHARAAYPEASIRGFALLQTQGLAPELAQINLPYVGKLLRRGGWIEHSPPV